MAEGSGLGFPVHGLLVFRVSGLGFRARSF